MLGPHYRDNAKICVVATRVAKVFVLSRIIFAKTNALRGAVGKLPHIKGFCRDKVRANGYTSRALVDCETPNGLNVLVMDWSNEKILKFLQNYESEPVLWNPQDPNHKKKHLIYDAWVRIKANLNWPVTVEELKAKIKSLMAYYRSHLNKYKKSLKSGAGKDDIYQTNWFAFSAMNSFLAPVYECQPTISTPQISEENETLDRIDTEDSLIEERPKLKKPRRENVPPEIIEAKRQMEVAIDNIKTSMNDEYEVFGKLIANKIKKLKDHNTREIVMNDIYNLIFRAGMIDRLQQSTPYGQSTYQSPQYQTYLPSPNPSTSTSQSPHHQTYLSSPNQSTSQSPHHQTYLSSPNPPTSQSPHYQTYLPSPNPSTSTSQSPHHQTYLSSPNQSTSQSPHHLSPPSPHHQSFFHSSQPTYITPPAKPSQIIVMETGDIQVVAEDSIN